MSRFRRSWGLFKRSMQVVRKNKKLLVFPIVVFLLTCVIALFFIAPAVLWDSGHAYTSAAHWKTIGNRWLSVDGDAGELRPSTLCYVLLPSIYMISMFLATFFNVAFYNEIFNALNERHVSISGGLRFALTRLKTIAMWSLFTGAVGLVIKLIEERVGFVGRWVVGFIGIAWSAASIFVVPSIVREQSHANPARLLKTSAGILQRTWGESLIGYLGIQFGKLLFFLGSIVLLGASAYLCLALDNVWILCAAFVAWILIMVLFMYIIQVANQIYLGALYVYATEGVVPGPFVQDEMDMAWKVKSGRKALRT